eukprot:g3027.t1
MSDAASAEGISLDASSVVFVTKRIAEARFDKATKDILKEYALQIDEMDINGDAKEESKQFQVKRRPDDDDGTKVPFRLMQWNILARGLANDGFFVNPILKKWPVGRGSFPTTEGKAESIRSMINAMQNVTKSCKSALQSEAEMYVRKKKDEVMFLHSLSPRRRKNSKKRISKKISGGNARNTIEVQCVPAAAPTRLPPPSSIPTKEDAPTSPPTFHVNHSMEVSTVSHIEHASRKFEELKKMFGISNKSDLHLLVLTALRLQAVFRGHKGRVIANLQKKYLKVKVERMKLLQQKFMTKDMIKNQLAVLGWDVRWNRIRRRILSARPDILTMQEVDTLAEMQVDLETLGYACGYSGCIYRSMHLSKSPDEACIDHVRRSGIAYAPNFPSTSLAISIGDCVDKDTFARAAAKTMGVEPAAGQKWTPRSLLQSKTFWHEAGGTRRLFQVLVDMDPSLAHLYELDADCSVVFWRKDRFDLVDLDYLDLGGSTNNDKSTLKLKSAVKATLRDRKTDEEIQIVTTHLASGTSKRDNKKRLRELFGNRPVGAAQTNTTTGCEKKDDGSSNGLYAFVLDASRKGRCILSMDANSRPQFRAEETVWTTFSRSRRRRQGQIDDDGGGGSGLGKTTTAADDDVPWTSIWSDYFDSSGCSKGLEMDAKDPPVTVNKMRGALSQQARKIGAHAYELIDHVWYTKDVELLQHAFGPRRYHSQEEAKLFLMPDVLIPSDHLPVIVDFGCTSQR